MSVKTVKGIPWAAVGFLLGAAAGLTWGRTAKSKIGESVSTEWNGGVLAVKVDTIKAAKSGIPDVLSFLKQSRG